MNQASTSDGIEIDEFQIDLAGDTDIGKSRTENQDHFLIADLQRLLSIRQCSAADDDCSRLFGSKPGQLLVVADGMGGHADVCGPCR